MGGRAGSVGECVALRDIFGGMGDAVVTAAFLEVLARGQKPEERA